jgi:hypothetical protein
LRFLGIYETNLDLFRNPDITGNSRGISRLFFLIVPRIVSRWFSHMTLTNLTPVSLSSMVMFLHLSEFHANVKRRACSAF